MDNRGSMEHHRGSIDKRGSVGNRLSNNTVAKWSARAAATAGSSTGTTALLGWATRWVLRLRGPA